MYSELEPKRIRDTISRMEQRIQESFPGSSLSRVAAEMGRLAAEAEPTARWLSRPIWPLRIGTAIGIVGIIAVAVGFLRLAAHASLRVDGVADLVQASEAATNEIILIALAIFFLFSLETRVKRARALAALHRLRSIVHIVDMHQLTKDPQLLIAGNGSAADRPSRRYTRIELARYLDFCSDLLAIASKLAALHVEYLNDSEVQSAVNDIEALSGQLSAKIWQKIMILDVLVSAEPARATASRRYRRRQKSASPLPALRAPIPLRRVAARPYSIPG